MVLKSDCKLPHVWVPGTTSPFTKGYCAAQAAPPDYETFMYKCTKPRIWVPGTKSPKTQGFCATPAPKAKSKSPPKKAKTPPKPKYKSPPPKPNTKSPPKKAKTPPKAKSPPKKAKTPPPKAKSLPNAQLKAWQTLIYNFIDFAMAFSQAGTQDNQTLLKQILSQHRNNVVAGMRAVIKYQWTFGPTQRHPDFNYKSIFNNVVNDFVNDKPFQGIAKIVSNIPK